MEQETLVQKIEQFSDDLTLLHRVVHGTEIETVVLGGVATPSLRKMAAQLAMETPTSSSITSCTTKLACSTRFRMERLLFIERLPERETASAPV